MTPGSSTSVGSPRVQTIPVVKCLRMSGARCTCDRFAGGQLRVVGPSEGCAHPPE